MGGVKIQKINNQDTKMSNPQLLDYVKSKTLLEQENVKPKIFSNIILLWSFRKTGQFLSLFEEISHELEYTANPKRMKAYCNR